VSRRRGKSRPPPRPPTGPAALRGWTIQRATGIGVVCGVAAILIAGLFATRRDGLLYPYAALLAVTAFRGFDVAVGLALLVPSLYALRLIWPELGL
jgi:hypothetical protein